MATPLSELRFHEGPHPISSDDESKVDAEVMQMGNFLQQQYGFAYTSILSKAMEFSASSLIPLFLTGKKNKVPNLVSILWDIYVQWKLSAIVESKKHADSLDLPKNFSFEYFLLSSPLGENTNISAKNFKLLTRGLTEYYFNYFWPISRSPPSLIADSFASYTKYAISMSQCVNLVAKQSDLLPLHLDFWIIPKSVVVLNNDSNDNDDNDGMAYQERQDTVIMNIEERLKLGGIEYMKQTVKNEKDQSGIGLSQMLSRKLLEILNPSSSPKAQKQTKANKKKSHRRVMTIVDRRNTYYDFRVHETKEEEALKRNEPPLIECEKGKKRRHISDDLYFYEVENRYGDIPDDYIQERLLFNTQQWLLPFCRIRNEAENKIEYDGGASYGWHSQVFLLSFHVNSSDDVKVYWYLNGDLMRFLPNNMLDIWPLYFYKDRDKKWKKEVSELSKEQIKKEWKLKVTDKVFQQYYRELIPKQSQK
mmetsp:Transcript_54052/g.86523  ORF Transcript_54052/g.86523 Transcript_54052/m.86523 type:complete len:477 (+) Transcript_54052:54-1484(+)